MCTRVFNNQNRNFPTTSRNMDWATQLSTSIFTFSRGLKKTGMPDVNVHAIEWKSEYASAVTMVGNEEQGYAASDGLNTKGLMANILYDTNANYGEPNPETKQLSVLRWAQYVLDTCSSVREVVQKHREGLFQLIDAIVPGSEKAAKLHLSVSDACCESAIIEATNDGFQIYYEYEFNGKTIPPTEFKIMTNQPSFAEQVLLNQYWRWQWDVEANIFASRTIPGGSFSTDRFERASFYLNTLNNPNTMEESLAQVRSVAANASVPIGFKKLSEDMPNIAPTLWTTMANHIDRLYYFSNSRTPGTLWIDLMDIDKTNDVQKIVLVKEDAKKGFVNKSINGLSNQRLKPAKDPYRKAVLA